MKKVFLFIVVQFIVFSCTPSETAHVDRTTDDGTWFFLKPADLPGEAQHTRHLELLGSYVEGYNKKVLQAIDIVQATAMDGGGYFAGLNVEPAESPIGYPLKLKNQALLEPPRTTSYCSGSSYAVFIETLNLLLVENKNPLPAANYEALRMQEMDGSRREDNVKFWGNWNADGFGNHFALVQYSNMADKILPVNARPGDFMNIAWKHGGGHSVIFLGWYQEPDGERKLLYWSSQKRTNGMGDELVSLDKIRQVMTVRLSRPDQLFEFNPETMTNTVVAGDTINW